MSDNKAGGYHDEDVPNGAGESDKMAVTLEVGAQKVCLQN